MNLVRRRPGRALSDRDSVLLARLLLLVTGVAVVATACGVRQLGQQNSVVQIVNIVMYPFAGVLLGIFLLGILTLRVNAQGALIGGILGFLGTITVPASRLILPHSLETPALLHLGRISNFYYGFLGTVLTVLVGYCASLLFAPPPKCRDRSTSKSRCSRHSSE